MLFSDPRVGGSPAPHATAAALTLLREQTIPNIIEPPRFGARAQEISARPSLLERGLRQASRHALLAAAVAALVLIAATALPAWSASRSPDAPAPSIYHSSLATTGSAATRVENLGVASFVGRLPFVQQARYLNTVTGATPEAQSFLQGAREASVATYVQQVGFQVSLPYVNDTVERKQALDTWNTGVGAEVQRQAVAAAAAAPIWEAPSLPAAVVPLGLEPGTVLPTSITFYACVGDGFCGNMASGQPVFAGAAACSSDLPFGTRFQVLGDPSGRTFVCMDRGALSSTWVDVWFYDVAEGWAWQSFVGASGQIQIVE